MKNKRIIIILATTVILLFIPLIAMQFTSEVNWTPIDFLAMGILLAATGILCEFIIRKVDSFQTRIFICGFILLGFFLLWAELAVGIF